MERAVDRFVRGGDFKAGHTLSKLEMSMKERKTKFKEYR